MKSLKKGFCEKYRVPRQPQNKPMRKPHLGIPAWSPCGYLILNSVGSPSWNPWECKTVLQPPCNEFSIFPMKSLMCPTVIQLHYFCTDFCEQFSFQFFFNFWKGTLLNSNAIQVLKRKFIYGECREEEMYSWGGLGKSRDKIAQTLRHTIFPSNLNSFQPLSSLAWAIGHSWVFCVT